MKRLAVVCIVLVLFVSVPAANASDYVILDQGNQLPRGDETGFEVDKAGAILDQSQETSNGGAAVLVAHRLGHTFRAGMTEQLHHVDLLIEDFWGAPTYPTTVSIVETVGITPSGAVLGSVLVPSFGSAGWYSVDFLPAGVSLTAETLYGIVVENDDPDTNTPTVGCQVQWYGDPYPRGHLWEQNAGGDWTMFNPWGNPEESDLAFRTWMVPEPSTLALLCMGAIVLVAYAWRKRRSS